MNGTNGTCNTWKRSCTKAVFAMVICLCVGSSGALADEKDVSFRTEDGWTIHATLTMPDNPAGKSPAVIFLPSFEHDRAAYGVYRDPGPGRGQYPGIAPEVSKRGVATLRLDLRGRGKSTGARDLHSFTEEELSRIYLDVRAAISFLALQSGIDADRIGLVAAGASADAAVLGWNGDRRIKAITLLSGRLGDAAKKRLAANPEIPMLLLVSGEDRPGFTDMTEAYFSSKSSETNIEVFDGLGVGTWMLSLYRVRYPNEKPLHEQIGVWMAEKLLDAGRLSEVAFDTEDGWKIHANLRIPQGSDGKYPAVILLHSGLSDRYAYSELEISLARAGLAVLNIDWRGKGASTNKGKYFDLTRVERDVGHLDVKAAVAFLSTQPGVDSSRIGVLGTVLGARYAMAALAEEPRIKTGVVLTGYIPTEKEKAYLTTHNVPVLYVTSRGHGPVTKALTEMHQLTRDKGSELITYDGGAIGYQLFKLDKTLSGRVVRWLQEKLNK